MESLPLDPGGFSGSYKLLGGRLSLDFVNTIGWPESDRPHDWFDPPTNVVRWALAAKIIGRSTARTLEREAISDAAKTARSLSRIRHQREIVRKVLEPLSRMKKPHAADVEALNELLAVSQPFLTIDPRRLKWTWETPLRLDEITRPVLKDAAEVLVHADRERLGRCPSCAWLFYDSTRNRTRRWCDMADCGSRDKSRRYYRRRVSRRTG